MARRGFGSASTLAADAPVGLALATLGSLGLGLANLPFRARWIIALEIAMAALFRPRGVSDVAAFPARKPLATPGARLSGMALATAYLLSLWKWCRMPLWGWDHFAIWGMKSRRLVHDLQLDLSFLNPTSLAFAVADYPIGLPVAWRVLGLGEPDTTVFKVSHALFALALLLSLRRGLLLLLDAPTVANTVTAAVALSPLFWDTEAVGNPDIAVACFAVSALVYAVEARTGARRPACAAGLCIGFLPWLKKEGVLLSILLLIFTGFLLGGQSSERRPRRQFFAILIPAVVVGAAAVAFAQVFLPPGVRFFDGDWRTRGATRLSQPEPILRAIGGELLATDWWGIWLVFLAGLLAALLTRRRLSAMLLGVIAVQLLSYCCVYFVTYLDPVAHVRASLFRIAAALVPPAALAIGFALAPRSESAAD